MKSGQWAEVERRSIDGLHTSYPPDWRGDTWVWVRHGADPLSARQDDITPGSKILSTVVGSWPSAECSTHGADHEKRARVHQPLASAWQDNASYRGRGDRRHRTPIAAARLEYPIRRDTGSARTDGVPEPRPRLRASASRRRLA